MCQFDHLHHLHQKLEHAGKYNYHCLGDLCDTLAQLLLRVPILLSIHQVIVPLQLHF